LLERLKDWILARRASPQNELALNAIAGRRQEYIGQKGSTSSPGTIDPDLVLSVTVVLYNNSEHLPGFLDSLVGQQFPSGSINLYLVDNGSEHSEREKIRDYAQQFRRSFRSLEVISQKNLGYGGGQHAAICRADTEFVLISNVDVEYLSDSIYNVLIAAVGDEDDVAAWELRQFPFEHPKYYDPVTLETNWNSHACVLVRREHYFEVGGYEPAIFMYGEDVELSYRLRRQGYRLKYIPAARVMHDIGGRSESSIAFQIANCITANFLIRLRYGQPANILVGFARFMKEVVKGTEFQPATPLLRSYFWPTMAKSIDFLSTRRKSEAFFPFRGFDFELARYGAEYQAPCVLELAGDMLPRVSIITRTVEGRSGLLAECMESVINQTYPNIEHIVLEDGGNSAEKICASTAARYIGSSELVYYSSDKIGRSAAGNRGMSLAAGEYFVFLDDDDLLFPDHVEVLMSRILESNALAAYSLAWEVRTGMIDKQAAQYKEIEHSMPASCLQSFDRNRLAKINYMPIQCVLFSRSLYGSFGGFDEDLDALEDWVLWKKYAANAEFSYIPKLTSMYRVPDEEGVRVSRQSWLDSYYPVAAERYREDLLRGSPEVAAA
jgi:GT2 family glycosyltransferase